MGLLPCSLTMTINWKIQSSHHCIVNYPDRLAFGHNMAVEEAKIRKVGVGIKKAGYWKCQDAMSDSKVIALGHIDVDKATLRAPNVIDEVGRGAHEALSPLNPCHFVI